VVKVWKESQRLVVGIKTSPQPSLNWGRQDRGSSSSQRKPRCRKWHLNSGKREQALTHEALAQAGVRGTERGGDVVPSSD